MVTLTCDNCDKPFEIDDDAAGEKVSCPYCGDIQRVPVTGANAASASPRTGTPISAAAATVGVGAVPAVSAGVGAHVPQTVRASGETEPEQRITVVRQAMFRAHPFWYSLMVLVFLGGIALAIFAKTSQQFADKQWMVWVGLGLSVAAILWWLIWWAAPHRWVKLVITNKRTIRQEGIVVRKTSEVLHNHIRNVKIEQSVLERLLGVGSLSIDSAGGSENEMIEIHMEKVPNPYGVKEVLDRYRRM